MVVYENVCASPFSLFGWVFGPKSWARIRVLEASGIVVSKAYPYTYLRDHVALASAASYDSSFACCFDDIEKRILVRYTSRLLQARPSEANAQVTGLQRELAPVGEDVTIACCPLKSRQVALKVTARILTLAITLPSGKMTQVGTQ